MPSLIERIVERVAMLGEGARLPPERAFAAELGVSRSSLREALQQLVSRGVVVSRRGGGTFVVGPAMALSLDRTFAPLGPLVRLDTGYWRDVMEIRKSLETDAAYHAAQRADTADRARIGQALAAMSAVDPDDPVAQSRVDAAFHLTIAEASHNVVLRQVVSGLADLLQASIAESLEKLYRQPGMAATLDRQHRSIGAAILGGHADEARAAAAAHLAFVEERLRHIEEATARVRRAALGKTAIGEETCL